MSIQDVLDWKRQTQSFERGVLDGAKVVTEMEEYKTLLDMMYKQWRLIPILK